VALRSSVAHYIRLTKPTIIFLVAITAICTMAAEGSLFVRPIEMLFCLAAIILSAGSANAFNQFFDRDIDAVMERTRKRRPLPLQSLRPAHALLFAIILGVISNVYLWMKFNALTALISIGTILFYVIIYTLWLKRRHYYNIVIGGAAGATAPLIASAAYANDVSLIAWMGFILIFMWTPPHFWALALVIKDEYQKVSVPMLPVVRGDKRTRIEIMIYTITLLPISLFPFFYKKEVGLFYAASAVILWVLYMEQTFRQLKARSKASYKKLFFFSILYLFLLFLALAVDGALRYFGGVIG
jgi:protoheme IX farnesyltransferase